MGLFSRSKPSDEAQDRRRAGLQTAMRDTGIDPEHLKYQEVSGTTKAVVRDTRGGRVVSRQRWS